MTALTTNTADSHTRRAPSASATKLGSPGVSSRLSLRSCQSSVLSVVEIDICRACSSGSASDTVVWSGTEPRRPVTPASNSSASCSEVFPDPRCPTRATLRIRSAGVCMSFSFRWCEHHTAEPLPAPVHFDTRQGRSRTRARGAVPVGTCAHRRQAACGLAADGACAVRPAAHALPAAPHMCGAVVAAGASCNGWRVTVGTSPLGRSSTSEIPSSRLSRSSSRLSPVAKTPGNSSTVAQRESSSWRTFTCSCLTSLISFMIRIDSSRSVL